MKAPTGFNPLKCNSQNFLEVSFVLVRYALMPDLRYFRYFWLVPKQSRWIVNEFWPKNTPLSSLNFCFAIFKIAWHVRYEGIFLERTLFGDGQLCGRVRRLFLEILSKMRHRFVLFFQLVEDGLCCAAASAFGTSSSCFSMTERPRLISLLICLCDWHGDFKQFFECLSFGLPSHFSRLNGSFRSTNSRCNALVVFMSHLVNSTENQKE